MPTVVTTGVGTSNPVTNAVFWHITPCGSYKNQHFGGMDRLHQQVDKNKRAENNVTNSEQPMQAAKKHYYIVYYIEIVYIVSLHRAPVAC
jgi:hypothetical protein